MEKSWNFIFLLSVGTMIVVVVHNVTPSLLKLLGQSKPNFMWSMHLEGEQKFK